ncbi:hypothetical protein M441DRAFT_325812 [Trichoderma asperellum CBS 433.97]|uniref:Uncharacterized protein n=1 Tax=Trichoderma asperellum (strain ATCC 204424 / CBS 433.97 / NBRC 101777) TaxID=1042311 RepID=A0A2T3ZM04_TRIA4|nr:hypothetical protein M441DRAFT_325812 [Trichoderma asperellum CBS 433.97]PTB45822.1 hypothetical protein M441DRAFT_325812 [Trichoderma asperellum CBS 433.97]
MDAVLRPLVGFELPLLVTTCQRLLVVVLMLQHWSSHLRYCLLRYLAFCRAGYLGSTSAGWGSQQKAPTTKVAAVT